MAGPMIEIKRFGEDLIAARRSASLTRERTHHAANDP
jgi:hypothetical protein